MARSVSSVLFVLGVLALSAVNAETHGRKLLDAGPYNVNSNKVGTQLNNGADVKNKGSVAGDPVLTAFDGQRFEFHGEGDHYYNLASESGVFQLSTLLKAAVMFDHKGTYMRGVALQQKDANVVVATGPDFEESITVTVNGEVLSIEDVASQSTKRSVPTGDGTTMDVTWQLFAPGIGPFVEIETASIKVSVSLTAPFADAGGVLQPNYLNANVTILNEPSQDLQGILGETYNTLRAGTSVKAAPKYPLFDDSKYELDGYFGTPLIETLASLAKMFTLEKPAAFLSR
eukprot:jgi/Botrbrau1/667/Bobra.0161s0051.1